jgi:hypothetical protein
VRLLLIVVLLSLSACAARPPVSDDALEIVSKELHWPVDDKLRAIRIVNAHGDVRARVVEREDVALFATIQRIGAEPLDPSFDTQLSDGTFTIVVRYSRDGRKRTDLAIFIPLRLSVTVETTSGLAQIRGARVGATATTTSGKIEATSWGDLRLRTESGAIVARQVTGRFSVADILSADGDVVLTVPAFADIALDAAGDRIEAQSGLPAPVQHDDGMRLDARFGTGARSMRVRGKSLLLIPGYPPED